MSGNPPVDVPVVLRTSYSVLFASACYHSFCINAAAALFPSEMEIGRRNVVTGQTAMLHRVKRREEALRRGIEKRRLGSRVQILVICHWIR